MAEKPNDEEIEKRRARTLELLYTGARAEDQRANDLKEKRSLLKLTLQVTEIHKRFL